MSTEEKKVEEEEHIKVEILPEDYAQYDLNFKIIFIGDSGVGKSCLTSKAVKNNFEDYYQATVGFEFLTFNMKLNKTVIKLQIWDTCGQEIYKSLITNFYRNSSLAVLVYSIDSRESFEHAEVWLKELKNMANPDVRIFLVGNKADLEENRQVKKEEGLKYKNDENLDLFLESSAKTGYNARSVLVEAAKMLYRDYMKYNESQENNNTNKDNDKDNNKDNDNKIKDLDNEKKEKKGCC